MFRQKHQYTISQVQINVEFAADDVIWDKLPAGLFSAAHSTV
jgi:hypothetical protein